MANAAEINKTIKDITTAADEAQKVLAERHIELQQKFDEILDRGFDRPLTAKEKGELGTLTAGMGALLAANRELAIITVRALNESQEVKRLSTTLAAINGDVETKLKKAAALASGLGKAADAVKKITAVLNGVIKLLAMFA